MFWLNITEISASLFTGRKFCNQINTVNKCTLFGSKRLAVLSSQLWQLSNANVSTLCVTDATRTICFEPRQYSNNFQWRIVIVNQYEKNLLSIHAHTHNTWGCKSYVTGQLKTISNAESGMTARLWKLLGISHSWLEGTAHYISRYTSNSYIVSHFLAGLPEISIQ